MNKKGAIELSIGTIVIIVLAMTMLIMGLILVRTIFSGAKYNVQQMNDKVTNEINKLFVEDKKTVMYLANQEAKITQGDIWGIAFGIKNLQTGVAEAKKFSYVVEVSDPDTKKKCGISDGVANSWITTGREDSINIVPGDVYYGIVRFSIPIGSPLCTIRYHLVVKVEGAAYATDFFDVTVQA